MGASIVVLGITAVAAFAQTPDTVSATITGRIGSEAGPASFGRVEAVELGRDGTVFVLDGIAHQLRAFGPDGSHRWSVGREGEGPGEFLAPVGLTIHASGDIWVIDPEVQRATVVGPSGKVLATHHLPAGMALSPWPGRFDGRGRLYSYAPDPVDSYEFRIIRYDGSLRPTATLTPPNDRSLDEFHEGRTARGSHMRTRVPFTPRLIWRLDSGGSFVWARTDAIRFLRRGADGEDIELSALQSGRLRVTSADLEAALDRLRRFEERGGTVDRARIPRTKPPLQTFVLDDRDRIWSVSASGSDADHRVVEVFEPDGDHVATVRLPFAIASFPVPVIYGDRIVGVERDRYGIERVVVAEVPGLAPWPEGASTTR